MSSSSAHQLSLRPTAPVASLEETKSDASLSTNPLADVRLVSSDKVGFPTQKVFLVAASVVFADMVATTGSSVDGDGSDMPDIALVEPAKVLELFLRFIDRTAKRPQLLSLEQAESLLQIADKYDSPVVMDIARIHARRFTNSSPAVVFGLAVAFGTLELAQEALAQFDAVVKQNAPAISRVSQYPPDSFSYASPFVTRSPPIKRAAMGFSPVSGLTTRKRLRDLTLSDVPVQYLRRFSADTIQNFTRLQDNGERSWAQKAPTFRIAWLKPPTA